jgi:hypothetical protein
LGVNWARKPLETARSLGWLFHSPHHLLAVIIHTPSTLLRDRADTLPALFSETAQRVHQVSQGSKVANIIMFVGPDEIRDLRDQK